MTTFLQRQVLFVPSFWSGTGGLGTQGSVRGEVLRAVGHGRDEPAAVCSAGQSCCLRGNEVLPPPDLPVFLSQEKPEIWP